jgi:hypothetical protein
MHIYKLFYFLSDFDQQFHQNLKMIWLKGCYVRVKKKNTLKTNMIYSISKLYSYYTVAPQPLLRDHSYYTVAPLF